MQITDQSSERTPPLALIVRVSVVVGGGDVFGLLLLLHLLLLLLWVAFFGLLYIALSSVLMRLLLLYC